MERTVAGMKGWSEQRRYECLSMWKDAVRLSRTPPDAVARVRLMAKEHDL
jgi:hypothetical protein